jgi:hypothetical protein
MKTDHGSHDGVKTGTAGGRRARWVMPVLALILLGPVAAACGEGSGEDTGGDDVVAGSVDFEATPDFLAAASRRSGGEPYRIESSIAIHAEGPGQDVAVDATLMTGEQDGESYEYHTDMSQWHDQLPSGSGTGFPESADLTQDMVSDGTTLYIRAPLYAAIVDQAGPGADVGPVGELAALGDDWGRVDLRSLADVSPVDVQSTAGAPAGGDPRLLLDLVASADDVEELGGDAIDGEPVNGLGAPLTSGELLEAQGADPEEFVDYMAANLGGLQQTDTEDLAPAIEAVMSMQIPFEVWVDGNGYVRRLSFEFDMVELMTSIGGDEASRGIDTFTMGATVDYSDYGDHTIQIELPPEGAADAPDMTEAYRRMLEAGQHD